MAFPRSLGIASWLTVATLSAVAPCQAQRLRGDPTRVVEVTDSSDVRARARRQQARFERDRVRRLPASWGGRGGDCDEVVGRFCAWFDGGDWDAPSEPEEVVRLRHGFLAYLDSVQSILPADGWIAGQRVWYRVEGDLPEDALAVAEGCAAEAWWCASLRGLALHVLGRYPEAETEFAAAVAGMDPEDAARWNDLEWLVDGDGHKALRDVSGPSGALSVRRTWQVADPLLLLPGNDRWTEHLARWTVATLRRGSRSTFGIPWGRDLDELTVRMGWEVGWRRYRGSGLDESVVGYQRPDGRSYMPRGKRLATLADAGADELQPAGGRMRSVYTSPAAPLMLPLQGQIAVFPRGKELVVVATHYLPADTAPDAHRDSVRLSWWPPGLMEQPPQAGLFLIPEGPGRISSEVVTGAEEGAAMVTVPAGRYVVGVESWDPSRARAGRVRAGLSRDTVPPDVPVLSDLLLLDPSAAGATTLSSAYPSALVRPRVSQGERVAVAWEVTGLGWAATELAYSLTVERTGGGLLRRLGQRVGLLDPRRPLSLRWSEPGPERPEAVFRVLGLDLGPVDPGEYEVTLELRMAGRGILRGRRLLTVAPPDVDDERPVF